MAQAKPFNGKTEFFKDALGKTFVDHEDAPIFILGNFTCSRIDLARKLGCAHPTAAVRLATALNEAGINTVAQLFKTAPVDLITVPGVGITMLYTAMCVLDANGYDVQAWYGWNKETVTASTLKHRKDREATHEKTGRREARAAKRRALAG